MIAIAGLMAFLGLAIAWFDMVSNGSQKAEYAPYGVIIALIGSIILAASGVN